MAPCASLTDPPIVPVVICAEARLTGKAAAATQVATAAVTPVMLVFGEVIPKAIAREWATTLILALYRPLRRAATVLAPFVGLAHAVVWANPHKGREGYEPLTGGMQAALPSIDHFVSGHSMAAFEQLAGVIQRA